MQVKRRREKPVEISVGDVVMLARDHGVRTYTQLVGQVGVVVAMHDMGSYLQSLATVRFFTQDRTWSVYAHRLEVLDAQDG
mgnify:FL=1